jgi:hypothetical protein
MALKGGWQSGKSRSVRSAIQCAANGSDQRRRQFPGIPYSTPIAAIQASRIAPSSPSTIIANV